MEVVFCKTTFIRFEDIRFPLLSTVATGRHSGMPPSPITEFHSVLGYAVKENQLTRPSPDASRSNYSMLHSPKDERKVKLNVPQKSV